MSTELINLHRHQKQGLDPPVIACPPKGLTRQQYQERSDAADIFMSLLK